MQHSCQEGDKQVKASDFWSFLEHVELLTQTSLRKLPLHIVLQSKWPVFELHGPQQQIVGRLSLALLQG